MITLKSKIEKITASVWFARGILIIGILVLVLPYAINWDGSYIKEHDNLEEKVGKLVSLSNEGQTFSFDYLSAVNPVLNGIQRGLLMSNLHFVSAIFGVFEPYTAYFVNFILVHSIGLIGLFLLLNQYVVRNRNLSALIAVCFTLMPVYETYGLSVLGVPFLVFCVVNVWNERRIVLNLGGILLFCFYSFLPLVGIFIIGFYILFWIVKLLKTRKWNKLYLYPFVALIMGYLLSNLGLIYYSVFKNSFVNHRTEFVPDVVSFGEGLDRIWSVWVDSHAHVSNGFTVPLIFAVVVLVCTLVNRSQNWKWLLGGLILTLFCSLFLGIKNMEFMLGLKQQFKILAAFQWDRLYFLLPAVYYTLFGLAIFELSKFKLPKSVLLGIILLLIGLQIRTNLRDHEEWNVNVRRSFGQAVGDKSSFKRFFAKELFEAIKKDEGGGLEKAAAVGIFPAILNYNGIPTIGGYNNVYSLKQKQLMRTIISKELKKNKNIKNYFEHWGSRCYVFSAEIGQGMLRKKLVQKRNWEINNLELNLAPLRKEGVHHLISTVPINNWKAQGLTFSKVYDNENSIWKVYVYRL